MSLYRREKSSVFWARFKFRGVEYRRSTGTADKRAAKVFERRLRAEVERRPQPRGDSRSLEWSDLEALDLRRASNRRREQGAQALSTLRIAWRHLGSFFDATPPHRITSDAIAAYIASRRVGVRGQTIRRELSALRRGLTLAGLVPPEFPRVESDPPRASQAGKLIETAVLHAWLALLEPSARDVALFAALTGLRAEEIARVEVSWVSYAPGMQVAALLTLPAKATKTRRARTVGLTTAALDILTTRCASGAPKPLAHDPQVLRREFRRACKALGVPPIHLRDLRHTYATLALAETGDLRATMEALGHSTLAAASRYQSSTQERTVAVAVAVSRLVGGM